YSAATTKPPVAIKPLRKPRRLTFSIVAWTWVMSRSCGGRLDGGGDALIAAAAADDATHGVVDLPVGGGFVGRKQCCGVHDLTALAIAALRDVQRSPRLLYRMVALRIEALDRRDRPARGVADRGNAGAGRRAVDMDRASPAQRHAATVFCPGEPQLVSKVPQQRHRRIAVERLLLAVDAQLDHGVPPD